MNRALFSAASWEPFRSINRDAGRTKRQPGAEHVIASFDLQRGESVAGRFQGIESRLGCVRQQEAKFISFCPQVGVQRAVVNLTTAGIPCIYYGTEQAFDSGAQPSPNDKVLRENMFGGRFGGKIPNALANTAVRAPGREWAKR